MPEYIRISPYLSNEEKKELRYHLSNHKHFHKPVKITIKIHISKSYDPKTKSYSNKHIELTHTLDNVVRIDWSPTIKNRHAVILTFKHNGSKSYRLYKNVIYINASKCGRIIPE